MIAKPNYFSTTKLTGEERKLRTNDFLKTIKVPTLEHLPLVADFNDARFRNDKEVAERCVILYGIIFVVHGEASGQEMIEYFKEFDLWEKVSPNERKFLTNKEPSDQERVEHSWKIEVLNVLLWSLSKFENLGLPISMCDFEHIKELPDLTVDPGKGHWRFGNTNGCLDNKPNQESLLKHHNHDLQYFKRRFSCL